MNKEFLKEILRTYRTKYPYSENEWIIKDNKFDEFADKLLLRYKLDIAELEAKVYTYERIIANSNFKSILSKDKQALEKRIKELENQIGSDKE